MEFADLPLLRDFRLLLDGLRRPYKRSFHLLDDLRVQPRTRLQLPLKNNPLRHASRRGRESQQEKISYGLHGSNDQFETNTPIENSLKSSVTKDIFKPLGRGS